MLKSLANFFRGVDWTDEIVQRFDGMLALAEENFILCADLRDKDGNAMPLDLYMAPRGRSYAVFHSEIDNRTLLQKLMSDGAVTPLR